MNRLLQDYISEHLNLEGEKKINRNFTVPSLIRHILIKQIDSNPIFDRVVKITHKAFRDSPLLADSTR